MTQIDIKILIDEINSKKNKEFIIEFEGIITAKIKIKNLKITEDENNINIFEKDIEQEKIKLLKYQIMKIEKIKEGYILKFDMLQNVKIKCLI